MYTLTDHTNRINLAEFPEWNCYAIKFRKCVKEENLRNQGIEDLRAYPLYSNKVYNLIPDDVDYYNGRLWSRFAKGKLEDGDKLTLHSKCDIPSTAIKKYETVTSVSKDVPTKYVIPLRGNGGGRAIFFKVMDNFVVFVDEDTHTVLLVGNSWFSSGKDRSYDTDLYMRTLQQELYSAERFHLMDGCVKYYQAVSLVDPMDYLIFNGAIPPELIINEVNVPVGNNPVTKDIILNSYRLLQSKDRQIQDTALITLAQHDCRGYEELLGWLFYHIADDPYVLKSKNSVFRWLMIRVEKLGRYNRLGGTFSQLNSIIAGRWLVNQITNGKVYWDSENRLCIEDQSVINPSVKKLIEHLP